MNARTRTRPHANTHTHTHTHTFHDAAIGRTGPAAAPAPATTPPSVLPGAHPTATITGVFTCGHTMNNAPAAAPASTTMPVAHMRSGNTPRTRIVGVRSAGRARNPAVPEPSSSSVTPRSGRPVTDTVSSSPEARQKTSSLPARQRTEVGCRPAPSGRFTYPTTAKPCTTRRHTSTARNICGGHKSHPYTHNNKCTCTHAENDKQTSTNTYKGTRARALEYTARTRACESAPPLAGGASRGAPFAAARAPTRVSTHVERHDEAGASVHARIANTA